jgi:uncharacterized membrane protein
MASAVSSFRPQSRVRGVDALRGAVMIVMALDHTRDYFHSAAARFQPDDPARTTVALFFTRWITHFCAPVFFFTAGIGAYLWWSRGRTKIELSRLLATRGLWLVFLELTVLRFIMFFSLTNSPWMLTILWALGWSMVALAVLAWLPVRILAPLSILVIALHNLADAVTPDRFGSLGWLWNILHQPGMIELGGAVFLVAYPLVPWFAVMSAGFCFGAVVKKDDARRRAWMVWLGAAATAAFLVIRWANLYGDPRPWSIQANGFTALSFLRVTKYSPSLDFLLMTLGPALLLLALFDRIDWKPSNPLIVFGRVPMFYFLAHFLAIHLLTIPFALVRYGRAGFLRNPLPSIGGRADLYPPGFGYSLGVVYAVWIAVVILMYPICLWFARLKERRRDWWLSYL